jgi:hypothetical protein
MIRQVIASVSLAAAVAAQGIVAIPQTAQVGQFEASGFSIRPFADRQARVQLLFDESEVGSSSLTVDRIQLRYDGPIPRVGAPGPFTIPRVRVLIGATSVQSPTARFDTNLSQPLTAVFDGPLTLSPDPGFGAPHPFGVGGLSFSFVQPVPIVIPAGGHLVVEIRSEGHVAANLAHFMLDAVPGLGGPSDGTATNVGTGCSASAQASPATITTTGMHAPGGAHFIAGSGLGANANGFVLVGLSDQSSSGGALPLNLPGTNCSLYNSADFALPFVTDSNGDLLASDALALVAPADAALVGARLFEQLVTIVPTANFPFGLVFSDQRDITLGSFVTPGIGAWTISSAASANAAVGDEILAGAIVVELRTL